MKILILCFLIVNLVSFSQRDTSITQFDIPPAKIQLPMPVFINPPEPEASYPGGVQEMKKFISNNVIYPQEAIDKGISDKVYVDFIVERSGELSNIKILRGKYDLLNQEVIRVLNKMPNWIPAQGVDTVYRTRCRIPISLETREKIFHVREKNNIDSTDSDGFAPACYAGGQSKLQKDLNKRLIYDSEQNTFDTLTVDFTVSSNCKLIKIDVLTNDTLGDHELKSTLTNLDAFSAALDNNQMIESKVTYTIVLPREYELKQEN